MLTAIPERVLAGAWEEARQIIEIGEAPLVWYPQPGPQAAAYASTADVIGYGGAAGGGKSDLLIGKAGTQHRRSIIFRRVFPSVRGMIERSREIFNATGDTHARDSYNEQLHLWRLGDGRLVEFGSVQYEDDLKKYQGQPHDFIGIDEATEFPERFVRFLTGWNRTTVAGQRCQTLLTFNPPLDDGGAWVVRFFAPWLDDKHPNPAQDGELRWFAMVAGKEIECGPEPFEHEGETITPRSRTFFHAALKDNPILAATGYGATIDAMPEPLRSLLKGNFDAARITDPWQVIPTLWVRLAQERWRNTPEPEGQAQVVGADPARGGGDQMVLAPLKSNWFAPLLTYPGASVPNGPTAAALLLPFITAGARIGIDVIGIGSSVYDSARAQEEASLVAVNFGEAAPAGLRDKSGRFKFANVRAAAYWAMREALDPDNGQNVCLPDDPELLVDLCAPRFEVTTLGIRLESKDGIKERIGRSPDKGDAAVIAWWTSAVSSIQLWV